jgi:predicted nucleic acid-binding protein
VEDRVLVDRSVLLRTLQVQHREFEAVARHFECLPQQGRRLQIVPQILVEFWVVATRPAVQNGLGRRPAQAAGELNRIKAMFELSPETPAIYPLWEALVTEYEVSGKPSHDARLAAAMKVHGLRAVLTFDATGFSRFPDVEAIDPFMVAALHDEDSGSGVADSEDPAAG